MADMRSLFLLIIHLLAVAARLPKTGGVRSVIAENLLLRQQLIVLGRTRNKAPNLKTSDRFILGGLSLFISAHRRLMTAVIVRPSTLLRFHRALVDRKYSRLFSNSFLKERQQAVRPEGSIARSHQCRCRTQAAKPKVWLSTHRVHNQHHFRCRDQQRYRAAYSRATLQTQIRQHSGALLALAIGPQQRQPLEC